MAIDVMVPRAERVKVNQEFRDMDAHMTEYVTDISRTGAFIRSKDPLPVGTRVNLRFAILLDEIELIEGVGEVVRISAEQDPGGQGMGVLFRRLSESSIRLLDRICGPAPAP